MKTNKSGQLVADKLVQSALAEIEHWQERLNMLYIVSTSLNEYDYDDAVKKDYGSLHSVLYRKLGDAYRRFFMVCLFDDKTHKEARRMAYKRFLDDGKAVMYLVDDQGRQPGRWRSRDEEELREYFRQQIQRDFPDEFKSAEKHRAVDAPESDDEGSQGDGAV